MIDGQLRAIIDPALKPLGQLALSCGLNANQVTIFGFAVGMLCLPLLAFQAYDWALLVLGINRLFDGLDGIVARLSTTTDKGAYLDIVLDFIFYSAFVLGMTLGLSEQAVSGAFLIFCFVTNGSAFLAFAIFAEKRKIETTDRGPKSLFYLGGLAEGFETICAFVVMCLFPMYFWLIAIVFGCMCLMSASYRIYLATETLQR
jgi:phosphatidylglycerophosphate synthase